MNSAYRVGGQTSTNIRARLRRAAAASSRARAPDDRWASHHPDTAPSMAAARFPTTPTAPSAVRSISRGAVRSSSIMTGHLFRASPKPLITSRVLRVGPSSASGDAHGPREQRCARPVHQCITTSAMRSRRRRSPRPRGIDLDVPVCPPTAIRTSRTETEAGGDTWPDDLPFWYSTSMRRCRI